MGMSMRVERSNVDQVRKRIEMNKSKQKQVEKAYDFEERMKELKEEVCSISSTWACCHFVASRKKNSKLNGEINERKRRNGNSMITRQRTAMKKRPKMTWHRSWDSMALAPQKNKPCDFSLSVHWWSCLCLRNIERIHRFCLIDISWSDKDSPLENSSHSVSRTINQCEEAFLDIHSICVGTEKNRDDSPAFYDR